MRLYEELATELGARIESGLYAEGQRLPSIRSLSLERGVSVATVQEAYRRLEDLGLAEPRPKSGYFVRKRQLRPALPDISRPAQRPLEVSQWEEVIFLLCSNEELDLVALGSATPDLSGSSLKPLLRNLQLEGRRDVGLGLAYGHLSGSPILRTQIARLAIDSSCALHPDEIIVTNGCQEALSCCIRATTQPGDVVAVDSPSFYGSMQTLRANGLKAMEIPTHPQSGISLAALELALEQWPIKALQLTPTCNNPLGYTMSDDDKQRLIALAQRFDLAIIEDDIYGDLAYAYPRPRSLKSFDHDGRVLLCSAFSKTVAPGLRVGWVAPGRYYDRVLHMKYVSTGGSPLAPQLALARFVADGDYARHLRRVRGLYRSRRDAMLDLVCQAFPAGAKVSDPQGGYLLWVELPEAVDTVLLNRRLRDHGVRIAPGSLFSASGKYRNCLRLNYAEAATPRLVAAVRSVGHEIAVMLDA